MTYGIGEKGGEEKGNKGMGESIPIPPIPPKIPKKIPPQHPFQKYAKKREYLRKWNEECQKDKMDARNGGE